MNDPPPHYRDPAYQEAQGWNDPETLRQQVLNDDVQALLYSAHKIRCQGDKTRALECYEDIALNFNNLEAAISVIQMYECGIGCRVDVIKACAWMQRVLDLTSDEQKRTFECFIMSCQGMAFILLAKRL